MPMNTKKLCIYFCLHCASKFYNNKRIVEYTQMTITNSYIPNGTNNDNDFQQQPRIMAIEVSFQIKSYINNMEYEGFDTYTSLIAYFRTKHKLQNSFDKFVSQSFLKFNDSEADNFEPFSIPKKIIWTRKILRLVSFYAYDFFNEVILSVQIKNTTKEYESFNLQIAFLKFIGYSDNDKIVNELLTIIYDQCSKNKLKMYQIVDIQLNDSLINKNIFCSILKLILSKFICLICKYIENYDQFTEYKHQRAEALKHTLKEYPKFNVLWNNKLKHECIAKSHKFTIRSIWYVVQFFKLLLQGIEECSHSFVSILVVLKINFSENVLDYLIWSTKILEESQSKFCDSFSLELFAYFFGYKNEMKKLCFVLTKIENKLLDTMKTQMKSTDKKSYFNLFFVKVKIEYDIKKRCNQIFAKHFEKFHKPYEFQKKFTDLVTEFLDKYTKIYNNIFNSLNETVICYYELSSDEIIDESNEVKQYVLDKIFNTKIELKQDNKKPNDFLNIILQDQKVWYDERNNYVYDNLLIKKTFSYKIFLAQSNTYENITVSNDSNSINNDVLLLINKHLKFDKDENKAKFLNEILKHKNLDSFSKVTSGTTQPKSPNEDLKSNNEDFNNSVDDNIDQTNVPKSELNENKILRSDIKKELINEDSKEINENSKLNKFLVKIGDQENKNTANKPLKKNTSQKQEVIGLKRFECKENAEKQVANVEEFVLDCTIDNPIKPTESVGNGPSQSICSSEVTNTTKGPNLACTDKIKKTSLISNKNTINIMENQDKKNVLEETIKPNKNLLYASDFDITEVQEEETLETIIDNEKEERADQNEIIENKQVRITEYNINKAKKNMHNNKSNKKSKKKKKIPTKKHKTDCNDDSIKKIDPNVEAETNKTMKNIEENTKTAINKTNSSDKIQEFNKTNVKQFLTNNTNLCKNIMSTSPCINSVNINDTEPFSRQNATEITPHKIHPEQTVTNKHKQEKLPNLVFEIANEISNKKTDKKGNNRVGNLYKSKTKEQNELTNYLKLNSILANDKTIDIKPTQKIEKIADGFENSNTNNDISKSTVMQNLDSIFTLEQFPETKKAYYAKNALLKLNDKNQSKNDNKKEEMILIGSDKREGIKNRGNVKSLKEETKNLELQYKYNYDTNIVRIPKNLKSVEYKYFVYQKANEICYIYVPVYANHDNNLIFIQSEYNNVFPLVSIKDKYNHPIINQLNKYIEKNVDLKKRLNNYNCATTVFFSDSKNILDNDYEFKIFECDIYYGTSCFVKSVKCIAQMLKIK